MPKFVWVNPAKPSQQYSTTIANDPGAIALGYVLTNTTDGSWQGADGVHDQNLQTQVGGRASGGYPTYWGYDGADPGKQDPNGILR